MTTSFKKTFILSILILLFSNSSYAQKIKVGFKSGVYFASKKSAVLYNGTGTYGINRIYTSNHLQNDINDELNFAYTLGDPPLNIKYSPALSIGGSLSIVLDEGDEIVFEGELVNLKTEDAYSINLDDPSQLEPVIKLFPIIGNEKRLNIDVNYKSYFDTEMETTKPYFFIGANAMHTEFISNQIYIGNLGPYTILPTGFEVQNSKRSGFGLGGNLGLGVSFILSDNTAFDFEYKATYNKINYGDANSFKGLHNSISVRFNWGK